MQQIMSQFTGSDTKITEMENRVGDYDKRGDEQWQMSEDLLDPDSQINQTARRDIKESSADTLGQTLRFNKRNTASNIYGPSSGQGIVNQNSLMGNMMSTNIDKWKGLFNENQNKALNWQNAANTSYGAGTSALGTAGDWQSSQDSIGANSLIQMITGGMNANTNLWSGIGQGAFNSMDWNMPTSDTYNTYNSGGGQSGGGQSTTDNNQANSDVELKENISLVGHSKSNINIYEFEYIDKKYGEGRYKGVMAQEVPEATSVDADGYLVVNYDKIDVDFERID